MKYLELISRDEEEVKEADLNRKAKLAKNSAERYLIDKEADIEEKEIELGELKAREDFSLGDVVERKCELDILKKELEYAREIYSELFE